MTETTDPPLAVFRADASASIGGGHVMRSLALTETLSGLGWRCALAGRPGTLDVVSGFAGADVERLDITGTKSREPLTMRDAWPQGCTLLVVDHYGLDAEFETACRPWARRILAIDDLADRPHDADLLLDQTLGRQEGDYRELVPDTCRMLLGPEYALLGRPFAEARAATSADRAPIKGVARILVSFGASDPTNATGIVLQGIKAWGGDAAVDVVLGTAAAHGDAVARQVTALGPRATLHCAVADMAGLMDAADLAIGAAGTASWERCCLGLACLLIVTADNQRRVAGALADANAAMLLGPVESVTPAAVAKALSALSADPVRLIRMSRQAAGLCDGRGATRVALAVPPARTAGDGRPVRLRLACPEDADTIFAWQRDERTRRYARNPAIPDWQEHLSWFAARLADMRCHLLLIEHDGVPAGTLRLDPLDGNDGLEVSILIAPDNYRLGIGGAALALARDFLPQADLHAEILPDNEASHRLFRAAGYREGAPGQYVSVPTALGRPIFGATATGA